MADNEKTIKISSFMDLLERGFATLSYKKAPKHCSEAFLKYRFDYLKVLKSILALISRDLTLPGKAVPPTDKFITSGNKNPLYSL